MIKVPRSVFILELKEEAVKMVIEGGLSRPGGMPRRLSLAGSALALRVVQAKRGGRHWPHARPRNWELWKDNQS